MSDRTGRTRTGRDTTGDSAPGDDGPPVGGGPARETAGTQAAREFGRDQGRAGGRAAPKFGRGRPEAAGADGAELLQRVARGDEAAFERLYDLLIRPLFGVVRRIVRDPAQSEEVVQEVMVELWRSAPRYSPARGSALTWALTVAHRRAVDRVRSAQAAADRDDTVGRRSVERPFDEVAEQVTARLEQQQVRRCLAALTELQRESVLLAYYGGRTYREVGELLDTPLGTVKTRLRDGLIRLRDCLGVIR